jgi:hypothetical protein
MIDDLEHEKVTYTRRAAEQEMKTGAFFLSEEAAAAEKL